MDYEKIYKELVHQAKVINTDKTAYYEKHHILPRSMGGGDETENLVNLTPRQHFIAHRLLEKMTKGTNHHHKMLKAVYMMSQSGTTTKFTPNSRVYDKVKEQYLSRAKLIQLNVLGGAPTKFNLYHLDYNDLSFHSSLRKAVKVYFNNKKLTDRFVDFVLMCLSLKRCGFTSISKGRGKEGNVFVYEIRKAIELGLLNKAGEFKLDDFESTLKQGSLRQLPSLKKLTKKLCAQIQGFSKFIADSGINDQIGNLIKVQSVYTKGKKSRMIELQPFNNWLSVDHPLAEYFYTPLDLETAKDVVNKLAA